MPQRIGDGLFEEDILHVPVERVGTVVVQPEIFRHQKTSHPLETFPVHLRHCDRADIARGLRPYCPLVRTRP